MEPPPDTVTPDAGADDVVDAGSVLDIGVAWRDGVNNANFDIGTTYLNW